jgi:hypothetical protein
MLCEKRFLKHAGEADRYAAGPRWDQFYEEPT